MSDTALMTDRNGKPAGSDGMWRYGVCGKCGAPLEPVWFREKERRIVNGVMTYTGRTRDAVSHLICSHGCIGDYPVDDSFDGLWE